ncbi:Rz1-like lysis system protein LysC [Gallibacterium salpingitidis]|uniref:Rz1-like lysis system protein LysC n=1 Tax=Gallibacterium salpingitidis TaxID=505341 RepID=UPI003F5866AB
MTLLIGCAQKTKIEYISPPQIYLISCDRSEFTGSTYGDAIIYLRQVIKERDICASRLDGIINWSKQNGNAL